MSEFNFISPYVRYAGKVYYSSFYLPRHSDKWLSNETENLLIYVHHGSYLHTINGYNIEMKEGMLMLIPPYANQIIGECITEYRTLYLVYFDLFDCEESRRINRRCRERHLPKREMYFAAHHTLTLIDESRRPSLIEKLEYIKKHYKNPTLPEALRVKSSILTVLAEFFESPPLNVYEKKPGVSLYIAEILRYVDHNYADSNLSVAGIAAHLGICPAYVSRLFKREMGVNLSAHISAVRISKAKDLFALGRRISDVVDSCGFVSLQAFSRTFHRIEGISPRDFIKQINIETDNESE